MLTLVPPRRFLTSSRISCLEKVRKTENLIYPSDDETLGGYTNSKVISSLSQFYGPHAAVARAYPTPQPPQPQPPMLPPSAFMPGGGAPMPPQHAVGGYTLPPTAAYFPMSAYSAAPMACGPQQSRILEGSALDEQTQPNTPDLLIHRRQVRARSFI